MEVENPRGYRSIEIWKMARELAVHIHKLTLDKLPKFEMYEQGSQIRRSAKSIASNIVEGYGRQRYKNDYIKFLTYALASCNETIDHLEMLEETGSLKDKALYEYLHEHYNTLGRKIYNFRQKVINSHLAPIDQIGQQLFNEDKNDENENINN